jgi:MFS family permease
MVGLIFCVFPFTNMLFSPIMGALCTKFGRLSVLHFGLWVSAGGSVLFGKDGRSPS